MVPLTTKNTVKQVFDSMKMWSPRVAGGRILGRSWSVVVAYFATVLLICDTLVLVCGRAMHKNHDKTSVFEHMAPEGRKFEFHNTVLNVFRLYAHMRPCAQKYWFYKVFYVSRD